ncbi:MAG: DUF1257 domain-containing protein [Limnothrix sp.]|jgi:hypothetical protein|uniref:DUF1257 domain-containing protein n=1 Tax=unclassified Limnothrix TaxID=2632864 RepID=UPI00081D6285|nr:MULTISPECIES: DUF1257 domain-containing protein [unclassified Limnothrix]MEB3116730.1 DUF1257 domain-containing protein [Limnothrix sp.]OCQ94962.1 hypothetical protein BCR12_15360 [Limnothrix sp. P13C2]RFP53697.1 MAG: DUF1257 domain-containing protein [Limnothrix sp. CACIAM 69d]MBD2162717.1 DUF1257 domain-containing protein [Limnothrix sp. FACHB-1083]MBD2193789.1 DUF1257 domain-containing protein [Limnothrix sp. FACHB-1088]
MSHFSQIKTQLRNLTSLKAALTDLGMDWKEGPATVRGYQGQTETADVAIEQPNGYDIGFAWNGQEYALVTDMQFWQLNGSVDRFLKQVTQRYAFHTVINSGAEQGFQVAEQVKNEDGSIRLVLQRWNG